VGFLIKSIVESSMPSKLVPLSYITHINDAMINGITPPLMEKRNAKKRKFLDEILA
jgi:hypothetical protein